MKKLNFRRSDWFLGVAVAPALQVLAGGELIQSVERMVCDLGARSTTRTPSDRIAVIANTTIFFEPRRDPGRVHILPMVFRTAHGAASFGNGA